jgi:hypothetical protein
MSYEINIENHFVFQLKSIDAAIFTEYGWLR